MKTGDYILVDPSIRSRSNKLCDKCESICKEIWSLGDGAVYEMQPDGGMRIFKPGEYVHGFGQPAYEMPADSCFVKLMSSCLSDRQVEELKSNEGGRVN